MPLERGDAACVLSACSMRGWQKQTRVPTPAAQELADLCSQQQADDCAVCESVTSATCLGLRDGLRDCLPCDVIQQPASLADTARRILACIPERTPYTSLAECRDDIATLLASLDTDSPRSKKQKRAE